MVSAKPDPNKLPFDVLISAFKTDDPVEGTTDLVREKRVTAVRHLENFPDPIWGTVWKVENHANSIDPVTDKVINCPDGCYMHDTEYNAITNTFTGGNDDRQRIEIRPNTDNTTTGIGLQNDITAYNWKLKIDKDFPVPDGFCHLFQYKAIKQIEKNIYPNATGEEAGIPILTLSITSSPNEMKFVFYYSQYGSVAKFEHLVSVPFDSIKDKWIEITVIILNSDNGWVTMIAKDLETGKILMQYNDPIRKFDMWRRPEFKIDGKIFEGTYPAAKNQYNRPKWGIYRKAEKNNEKLKGAKIFLTDLNLYKCAINYK
jgi:hypothetical protein